MSNRLAFQTQLASIMEDLANAAVAEICKLVDDDYAVVSLQMSQCQRENKALKRKLHLLELKMARGHAERRLRESCTNSYRPRVQIVTGDRRRDSSPPAGQVFERQMDHTQWSDKDATGDTGNQPVHSDNIQSQLQDVELLEPGVMLVKEEKVEANVSCTTEMEDILPFKDNGVVDRVHQTGVSGQRLQLEESIQNQTQHSRTRYTGNNTSSSSSSRGVEVSDCSPLLNCELSNSVEDKDSLQETLLPQQCMNDSSSDSQFDLLCDGKSTDSLVEKLFDAASAVEAERKKLSCSYSMAAIDFPSTSSGVNGWAQYSSSQPFTSSCSLNQRIGTKERLFACSYCGKAFNRPKKLEIHQRIHTGEKPFSCSTCGKMFSEAGNLKKHQRVHTGEKPYNCGMCGKGFAWIRNLKTHQLKNHPQIYTEEEMQ